MTKIKYSPILAGVYRRNDGAVCLIWHIERLNKNLKPMAGCFYVDKYQTHFQLLENAAIFLNNRKYKAVEEFSHDTD